MVALSSSYGAPEKEKLGWALSLTLRMATVSPLAVLIRCLAEATHEQGYNMKLTRSKDSITLFKKAAITPVIVMSNWEVWLVFFPNYA